MFPIQLYLIESIFSAYVIIVSRQERLGTSNYIMYPMLGQLFKINFFLQISELEEKVKNMQMLKFGRLVDLERLENVTVNRTAEELKERLRQQELQNANELAKWEVNICELRFIKVFITFFIIISLKLVNITIYSQNC